MTPRQQIVAAMRDGARAAAEGEPISACPYRTGSADRLESVLATLWLRAYDRVASLPVDYRSEGSGP